MTSWRLPPAILMRSVPPQPVIARHLACRPGVMLAVRLSNPLISGVDGSRKTTSVRARSAETPRTTDRRWKKRESRRDCVCSARSLRPRGVCTAPTWRRSPLHSGQLAHGKRPSRVPTQPGQNVLQLRGVRTARGRIPRVGTSYCPPGDTAVPISQPEDVRAPRSRISALRGRLPAIDASRGERPGGHSACILER